MELKYGYFLLVVAFAIFGLSSSCSDGSEETDINAGYMQDFIKEISLYAKAKKPGFIIIPQNGSELAFNYTDPDEGINDSYVSAIDGIGIEELFYDSDGNSINDDERLSMLRALKPYVKIMVSDYAANSSKIENSINRNKSEGFISFPRSANNYDYEYIPSGDPTDKNLNNISVLGDAKNYLYLISTDQYSKKEDFLSAVEATNYDVILIDLFFDEAAFTKNEIDRLKIKADKTDGNKQRLVIAYISIGSAENYRYYWETGWRKGDPSWIKKNYEGYSDEYWVEFWDPEWKNIVFEYIDKIIDAGFDGAYLDNVEAYYFLLND